MTKLERYCDKYKTKDALPVSVFKSREMDAAGDTDNDYVEMDFGHQAAIELLNDLFDVRGLRGFLDEAKYNAVFRMVEGYRKAR